MKKADRAKASRVWIIHSGVLPGRWNTDIAWVTDSCTRFLGCPSQRVSTRNISSKLVWFMGQKIPTPRLPSLWMESMTRFLCGRHLSVMGASHSQLLLHEMTYQLLQLVNQPAVFYSGSSRRSTSQSHGLEKKHSIRSRTRNRCPDHAGLQYLLCRGGLNSEWGSQRRRVNSGYVPCFLQKNCRIADHRIKKRGEQGWSHSLRPSSWLHASDSLRDVANGCFVFL